MRARCALFESSSAAGRIAVMPAVVLASIVGAAASESSQESRRGTHVGIPPLGAQRILAPSFSRPSSQFEATIRSYCEDRRVEITWAYSPTGAFVPATGGVTESFAVSYWPTATDVVGADKILVAGKQRNGRTRIELWTTRLPLVRTPAPGTTGPTMLVAQGLASIDVVFDDAIVGRDMVRGILKRRGAVGSALLQFHDSRDVVTLDWTTTPATLTSTYTAQAHPELRGDFAWYQAGDHASLGYVYMFSGDGESVPAVPTVVLTDANRDGTVDSIASMTTAQFIASGLHDRLQYLEYAGN